MGYLGVFLLGILEIVHVVWFYHLYSKDFFLTLTFEQHLLCLSPCLLASWKYTPLINSQSESERGLQFYVRNWQANYVHSLISNES